ncbi:hypothetical protein BYT27DRAFT_6538160 [Phlegmacium glaucopus]|nr:hypothetical protein BYT27DRAFT_6538160 [Phlegmacium glaucopus]
MSVRSHAPACLKKELDTILTLQRDLAVVEKDLHGKSHPLCVVRAIPFCKDSERFGGDA